MKKIKSKEALVVAGFLFIFLVQACTIALKKSNTWDESAHILAGYAYLSEGADYLSPLHHPVTGRLVTALYPYLFLDLDFDPRVRPELEPASNFFPYSLKFLFENRTDGGRILFLSRLGVITLGLVLGLFVYIWARELWGERGGMLSLLFYSLSPNIIAHSSLATTDIPVTVFFFISSYFLYRTAESGADLWRVPLVAAPLALAFTTKHTAFLILPLVIYSLYLNIKRDGPRKALAFYLLTAFSVYILIWAVYGFRYHSADTLYVSPPWERFSGHLLEGPVDTMRTLKILPESYLFSIAGTLHGAGHGRIAFLMGDYSHNGWWYFFIVAFLIKTPVATILLLTAAILYLFSEKGPNLKKALFALIPLFSVFFVISLQKVNIGLRHILPAYPFIFLLVGYSANIRTVSMRAAKAVFYAALAWYVYAAASIYPHELAYFNEFVGGPENGYKYLVDSNLDWGQDLTGLKRYMDDKGLKSIKLAYFGLSDPTYYGIDYEYLPGYIIFNPENVKETIELKGTFAISATLLQGLYLPDRDFYRIFRSLEPAEKIGYSIFIYEF